MAAALPPEFKWVKGWLDPATAGALFEGLNELPWARHSITIFGRTSPMPREIAYFGPVAYGYSGITHRPAPLPAVLLPIREQLVSFAGTRFDTVLLNRYRDGSDAMGWHSDDDYQSPELTIASVSLGATRRFRIRPKGGGPSMGIDLGHGDLLLMAPEAQRLYQHAVTRTRRKTGPRINLTWRRMAA